MSFGALSWALWRRAGHVGALTTTARMATTMADATSSATSDLVVRYIEVRFAWFAPTSALHRSSRRFEFLPQFLMIFFSKLRLHF